MGDMDFLEVRSRATSFMGVDVRHDNNGEKEERKRIRRGGRKKPMSPWN